MVSVAQWWSTGLWYQGLWVRAPLTKDFPIEILRLWKNVKLLNCEEYLKKL